LLNIVKTKTKSSIQERAERLYIICRYVHFKSRIPFSVI